MSSTTALTAAVVGVALGFAASRPVQAQPGPDLMAAFDKMDLNHDGVVSRSEFGQSRAARFHALDRNHDGYLSREDIPPIAMVLRPDAGRMLASLAPYDLDHDGRISFDEFVAGSMALFDEADANHDGVLTPEEARAAAARFRAGSPSTSHPKP